jgi:hypothetical protein
MIYFSSDSQIAYYHAPKNGSRTMLGYLALIKEPDLYNNYPGYFHPTDNEVYSELRERVQRNGKHHYNPNEIPIVDNPYRIVVKRDPVKRFISGYTNRVLHHRKLKETPDFDTFLENFDKYKSKYADIETHFKPQINFFGKDRSIFTHIFDTSEMHLVKEFLEDLYQRNFPDIRLQQGGNHNKIKPTKQQEDWIRKRYKDDYDAGWC